MGKGKQTTMIERNRHEAELVVGRPRTPKRLDT